MNNPLIVVLIIEAVAIVVMLLALVWLIRAQLKIKHDYLVLNDIVHSNCNDIAGLCSAALTIDNRIATVDDRIAATDGQIDTLAAKITEAAQYDQSSSHPYSGDIRKVRSGASINELMQNSGLSHDEAALLIRLHGSKTQS